MLPTSLFDFTYRSETHYDLLTLLLAVLNLLINKYRTYLMTTYGQVIGVRKAGIEAGI